MRTFYRKWRRLRREERDMFGKSLGKYGVALLGGALTVVIATGVLSMMNSNAGTSKVSPSDSAAEIQSPLPEAEPEATAKPEASVPSPTATQKSQTNLTVDEPVESTPSASTDSNVVEGPVAPREGITPISALIRNTQVAIVGTVQRLTDEDEFVISDQTGSVLVYTGRTHFPVEAGQSVTVRGRVDDARILEVYADEILLPDGSVVPVTHWE